MTQPRQAAAHGKSGTRAKNGARGSKKVETKGGARITEHRLANGLRVLIAERHSDPVVAVMTWYRVGARNEREHEAGVSHFLEHMMFKGSKRFGKGEVDQITTVLGGSNNAYTSYDHTAYWFELASDRWEKALEIEADRMRHLTLDPKEYQAEREVVIEELAMGLDDPWRRLSERVMGAVFDRHPYRRPIIGYTDALRALSVEGMRDYYRRFYHPGNATLVLSGDLEPKKALALARKYFESIPAGPGYEEADCFRPEAAGPAGEQRLSMTWDDQGRRLCMAWPGAPIGSEDDDALEVLATLLGSGRLSRLHRRLVLEDGLATSVSVHDDARVEGGLFWIFVEAAQGAAPAKLEAAVNDELERLRTKRVTARELQRVRSQISASEAFDSETATDLAEQLGEFATDAHWRLALESLGRMLAVDAAQLQDCARRLLAPERRVIGWCLPREAPAKPARARKPRRKTAPKTAVRKKATKKAARASGRKSGR